MGLNHELLRRSFALVLEREPDLSARFYVNLFTRYPESARLFSPARQRAQEQMLAQALVAVVEHLEDGEWLRTTLGALGAKHVDYGVTDDMYGWVGDALLLTLSEVAGSEWSPELAGAWSDAYGAIVSLMLSGATEARAQLGT